ncbi:MAG: DNA primase [Anaerolineae bacterium]
MSAVDEIKERLDIVEVISTYVPLKKAGRNFKGLCPFHTEKTPSFVVFPDNQSWYCFGACGTGGDLFTFVMKRENMEFPEALRLLARRAGVSLAPRSPAEAAEQKRLRRLREINAAAASYFHNLLMNSDAGERARHYLAQREIGQQAIVDFQLGYALDSWDALKQHLTERGYQPTDLLAAGLVIEREGGGDRRAPLSDFYDRFRGRLMFPIRDIQGHTIGFGARALDDSVPKYLNSPQTPLFDKGRALYGIDMAKGAIRANGRAVIVEGYTDVITAHQNGFGNVVASMGTALTESQLRTLKRLTKNFVLALDADAAGREATKRGLDVASRALDRRLVPVPLGRGLIRHEQRLNADIRIVVLPPGRDPDDVIKEEPAKWAQLLQEAVPVVEYYFRTITTALDLTTAKGKAAAVRQLLPIIGDVGDEIERTHYLQKLGRMVQIDERVLLDRLRKRKKSKERLPIGEEEELPSPTESKPGLEEYCLSTLLRNPAYLHRVKDLGLRAEDFFHVDNRQIFGTLQRWAAQSRELDLDQLRIELDPALHEQLDFLARHGEDEPELPFIEVEKIALRLREQNKRREIQRLRFLQEEAQEQNDLEALNCYREMIRFYTTELNDVQERLYAKTSAGRHQKESSLDRFSFWSGGQRS